MNISKYIKLTGALAVLLLPTACSEDELGPTIFPDVPTEADPNSYTYKFDTWLNQEFRDVYNLDFKYKMEDVEADMNYNLVPATFENARDLCLLTKYLWFDSYGEHVGPEFLKQYGPRILHLIGSPAYNPNSGTEILGLAEGGLKVSLFKVNEMTITNINQMNEMYFKTMHHEFGHILHQTKTYPSEFNELSNGRYDDSSWQSKDIGYVAGMGFITAYASSQPREDFAETIANYLTRTDESMELLKWMAAQGWETDDADALENDPSAAVTYYCRFYQTNPDDESSKVYLISSMEKDWTYRPCIVGVNGEHLYNVADVEAYLANYAEKNNITLQVFNPLKDNADGLALIERKQNIVRNWFKEEWGLDFDALREIVQRRQREFNIEELRKQIDAIPDPVVK